MYFSRYQPNDLGSLTVRSDFVFTSNTGTFSDRRRRQGECRFARHCARHLARLVAGFFYSASAYRRGFRLVQRLCFRAQRLRTQPHLRGAFPAARDRLWRRLRRRWRRQRRSPGEIQRHWAAPVHDVGELLQHEEPAHVGPKLVHAVRARARVGIRARAGARARARARARVRVRVRVRVRAPNPDPNPNPNQPPYSAPSG